jgi:hypothetical protein
MHDDVVKDILASSTVIASYSFSSMHNPFKKQRELPHQCCQLQLQLPAVQLQQHHVSRCTHDAAASCPDSPVPLQKLLALVSTALSTHVRSVQLWYGNAASFICITIRM